MCSDQAVLSMQRLCVHWILWWDAWWHRTNRVLGVEIVGLTESLYDLGWVEFGDRLRRAAVFGHVGVSSSEVLGSVNSRPCPEVSLTYFVSIPLILRR